MDNVKVVGSWSLNDDHIKELFEAYPEHKNVLECLMSKDGALHDKRHSKLAQIALASEEQAQKLFWTFRMEWLINVRDMERHHTNIIHAPRPISGKQDQKYYLSMQFDVNGKQRSHFPLILC